MSGRIRSITSHQRENLRSDWALTCTPPDALKDPQSSTFASLDWTRLETLGTAASALRAAGSWNLDGAVRRFDAQDWWYRLRFKASRQTGARTVLGFDGLATVADAWLNGELVLTSDTMFLAHEIETDRLLADDNELILRFRSLDALLAAKRPRPRWRAPMIEHQQLRWFRTTLLGRTPGWSPPAAAVGPWRPIWLETREALDVTNVTVRTSAHETSGIVEISCDVSAIGAHDIATVVLRVSRNGREHALPLHRQSASAYSGRLEIRGAVLWWPHTHGEPALYDARLCINETHEADLGRIGFRSISLDTRDDGFTLHINGVKVFCRGACWTPLDCVSLQSTPQDSERALAQVASAGMNMLRVGGTMVYESDAFLDACDAHGVMLWQDFMFANMDYPEGDGAFNASVVRECKQLLQRLGGRPCLAVLCGNSEVEQQAAMWGAPRERWKHSLFEELLPRHVSALAPDVPYWPSSAHGGAFPYQANSGTTSYYGVGAYRRPLSDARRAEVRFASECLAFANIPEAETLAAMPGGSALKVHHPTWKTRVPRDLGAGWDFDDIRDHYLTELFRVNPLELRYADHDRYLEMGRVAPAEVMAATFREWRRRRSTCSGALVWFWRDLWAGAGWGVIGADGLPKAPYYTLRRALRPLAVSLSDEGVNGLFVHVINEAAAAFTGCIELAGYRNGETRISQGRLPISLAPREAFEAPATTMFEGFVDLSYAYRFGPPAYDLAVATLLDERSEPLGQDFYFPLGMPNTAVPEIGLTATARMLANGDAMLCVQTQRFAQSITIRADRLTAEDQYFHLAPGASRDILLRRSGAPMSAVRGTVRALNSLAVCTIANCT